MRCFAMLALLVVSFALMSCGGGKGSTAPSDPTESSGSGSSSSSSNSGPVLASITPDSAFAGGPGTSITVSGSGFVSGSAINWNGTALGTQFVNTTTLSAQLSAAELQAPGSVPVTVSNPSSGGTSAAVTFTIHAAPPQGQAATNIVVNSIAWDAVHQVIYLSLPGVNGAGGGVQVLNPFTGVLGNLVPLNGEPDLLAVSANGEYLYVGLDQASMVQRMLLPNLTADIQIALGSTPFSGPLHAMDLQASPTADGTVVYRSRGYIDDAERVGRGSDLRRRGGAFEYVMRIRAKRERMFDGTAGVLRLDSMEQRRDPDVCSE